MIESAKSCNDFSIGANLALAAEIRETAIRGTTSSFLTREFVPAGERKIIFYSRMLEICVCTEEKDGRLFRYRATHGVIKKLPRILVNILK